MHCHYFLQRSLCHPNDPDAPTTTRLSDLLYGQAEVFAKEFSGLLDAEHWQIELAVSASHFRSASSNEGAGIITMFICANAADYHRRICSVLTSWPLRMFWLVQERAVSARVACTLRYSGFGVTSCMQSMHAFRISCLQNLACVFLCKLLWRNAVSRFVAVRFSFRSTLSKRSR
jgi:hypothetical protein